MNSDVWNKGRTRTDAHRRVLAALLALCLVLSQLNSGLIAAYAQDGGPVTFNVGTGVAATLADGTLTLSGTGDTDNFTAESAPFAAYADDIRTLEIEDGVTYLGDYLFYGLGALGGDLSLPGSIVGFGDAVFSGASANEAAHFSAIDNRFESGEVVRPVESAAEQPTRELPEVQVAAESNTSDSGYTVERVVQQEIANPQTLFYPSQDGSVVCSDENASFLAAALSAGFQQTDSTASMPQVEQPESNAAAMNDAQLLSDEPAAISDPAPEGTTTVYVKQEGGNDSNDGLTQDTPVQTLDGAAAKLKTRDEGGSVETNRIVIMGTYARSSDEVNLLRSRPVPVTISGGQEALLAVPANETGDEHPLHVFEDFCLEHIETDKINHVYANGHSLTIGDGVSGSKLYLYAYGQNAIEEPSGQHASLTVKSGSFARIVGYVRSTAQVLDCTGLVSDITVEGSARVDMLAAGCASGGVKNATVNLVVNKGTVGKLLGGNQGYQTNNSPYSGTTSIVVNGGTVTDLLGAGSGRNGSIPTYEGELDISVTGGTVTNLYGAGSAAYVISGGAARSSVSIAVSGGQVASLFAAGKGWDDSLDSTVVNDKAAMAGSLTGKATVTVGGTASVGNIYASGQGASGHADAYSGTKNNSYVDGEVSIAVNGGTVTGSIYGGGQGIATAGYEECARVTKDSRVQVSVSGGTVKGSVYGGGQTAKVEGSSSVTVSGASIIEGKVYGGGQTAKVEGSTSVTLSGGTVEGNVYGGGQEGVVQGATNVNIEGGTVTGSVYGGALGVTDKNLVLGGSTVNMTGGWVRGNLYGGSELSDDGAVLADNAPTPDLVVTNLVGGTVSGNVFGGGYKGKVNGSTHMHVGLGAMADCVYYKSYPELIPSLTTSALSVGGSVYAGGDFGDGTNYDAITVLGTSHVYIDGTDYDTGGATGTGAVHAMTLNGAVFGSGASCDAGKTRLVTLENYGASIQDDDGVVTGATRTLTAIQRADRVVLRNSHVKLTGQSDAANVNQTALYSLNRIGDHGENAELGSMGNGLVLQAGSTAVLESPATGLAALRSLNTSGNEVAAAADVASTPNTLLLDTGTLLRVSYTAKGADTEVYGPVKGYTRLLAAKSTEGYAYARIPAAGDADGGFVDKGTTAIAFTDVAPSYRYWRVSEGGAASNVTRQTVLTARKMDSGADDEGFSVAKGVIELPPADKNSVYTVKSVIVGDSALQLAEAAKTGQGEVDGWKTAPENSGSGPSDLDNQKAAIKGNPLTTFGLYMRTGEGFVNQDLGKVVSNQSIVSSDPNTVLNAQTSGGVTNDHVVPEIEFYLTYYNDGITASRDLGTVTVEFERSVGNDKKETTKANVQIVTKTTSLSSLELDLYATQTGTYTGKLNIPSGASRSLSLTGVSADGTGLMSGGSALSGNQFSLSLQAVSNQGWQSAGLMDAPYDLGSFASGSVSLGTTDSRYDAPIEFVVKNAGGFPPKTQDTVVLTLKDDSTNSEVPVTLKIHWEESVVASAAAGAGRQYNARSSEGTPTITQDSAMTAVFTLSNSLQIADSWLELQNDGGAVAWPAGAELTLMDGAGFYRYRATGTETDKRIALGNFAPMVGGSPLSGSISNSVTIILDLGPSTADLPVGDYSLRLRHESSADSVGANCVVNNTGAKVQMSGTGGLSKDTHSFTLTLAAGSDTRFADGAAVVLAPGGGETFPEGTVFTLDGAEYYPSGGKVYLPPSGTGPWNIAMDTANTVGLADGEHMLSAQMFATGASAGAGIGPALSAEASYDVGQNPAYALDVSLASEADRIVSPGAALSFIAEYAVGNDAGRLQIAVDVQKKTAAGYESADAWTVVGNTALVQGDGSQTITVTVPESLDPGTYRMNFKLGDLTVPYNLIVAG